jgi:uncharacterized membrane protein YccC
MELASSQLGRDLSKFDWAQYDPKGSAYCLPAMTIALGLGLYFQEPAAGIIVATGTFSVGLSSFRQLQGSRLLQMLLTCLGLATAAALGTETGHWPWATTLAAGACGFFYGLVLVFSDNASWIVLQFVIAYLVASAFPAFGWHVFQRSALVMMGGILQIGLVLILWRGKRVASIRDDFQHCHPVAVFRVLRDRIWPVLLQQVNHRLPVMRYAIRVGLTLMLAESLSRLLHQLNAYWLPMTALLVMKPDFYRTYSSSVARVLGTFAGVVLASLLTWMLHPTELLLCGLALAFAWTAFASHKVNYGVFTCALTSFIVFLVATAGLPEMTVTANRLLDTALGSLIGLGSRAIGPKWDSVPTATPVAATEHAT